MRGRAQQQRLLAALNAWSCALRRDECGDWCINCEHGHVYAAGNGWLFYVATRSPRAWTAAKERLALCTVTQAGDDEGVLRLDGLPTPEQATAIRKTLGIRKRKGCLRGDGGAPAPDRISAHAKSGFQRPTRARRPWHGRCTMKPITIDEALSDADASGEGAAPLDIRFESRPDALAVVFSPEGTGR
jgi:hypothetical protein